MKSTRLLMPLSIMLVCGAACGEALLSPSVIAEETVAFCLNPKNGSGPLWCYGSPILYRDGENVYASIMEASPAIPIYGNTRFRLFARNAGKWSLAYAPKDFRDREPCPLGGFPGGDLFVSINPSTNPINPGNPEHRECEPRLLRFNPGQSPLQPAVELPKWNGKPNYTDHSYRGFAVDSASRELLCVNIDSKTGVQHWALRGADGEFIAAGGVEFPIRACYPQVALRGRAGHILAIGDIVEPIDEWRTYKFEKTGSAWDYVFRRLFYAGSKDISKTPFSAPIEVDSVESTGGHISNLDLWIDAQGRAHILYLKNNINSFPIRDKHQPGLPHIQSLDYAVIDGANIIRREIVCLGGEVRSPENPLYGRFHATPDGRLWAVYNLSGPNPDSTIVRLVQVHPEVNREAKYEAVLNHAIHPIFTATERGGSLPSWTLDLIGSGSDSGVLRYAQIKLK